MANRYIFTLLLAIVALGAILRFYDLASNPPGFYTDEASIGFNAYTILTSAKDEHGAFLPIFFKAFGEYKTPFAIYPVVSLMAIFGVNELAVRLYGAVLGVVDIALMFFLGKILFNRNVGLLSAFVLSIAPWHVHLSRFLIESHNALIFFVIGGILFFVLALRNNWQTRYLILSSLFWALSLYTYFAVRIFTPLFLLGLLVLFKKDVIFLFKNQRRKLLIAVFFFCLITLPFFLHVLSGEGLARFQQVAFSTEGGNVTGAIVDRLSLYLKHFDPRFIFVWGDADFPGQLMIRLSVSGIGLFYKWQLLFFLFGLCFLFLSRDEGSRQNAKILLLILLLYPLGTIVSDAKTPYATRSVIGVIAYTILIAYGIYGFLRFVKEHLRIFGRLSVLAITIVLVLVSVFYLERYLALGGAYKNRAYGYNGFQYGARQVVDYFVANQNEYNLMLLGSGFDGPSAYINFFSLGQCAKCKAGFNESWQGGRQLVAVSVGDLESFNLANQSIVHRIYYPDGREAFYIYARRAN